MLVPAAGTRFESACSPADQAGTCKRDLQRTLRKAATDGASFAAAPLRKAEADARCMLVPARLESACCPVNQAATYTYVICNGVTMKLRLMEQALWQLSQD